MLRFGDGRSVVIESRGGVWLSEVGEAQVMVNVVRSSRRDMVVGRMGWSGTDKGEGVCGDHARVVGGSRTAPTGLVAGLVGFGNILGWCRTRRVAVSGQFLEYDFTTNAIMTTQNPRAITHVKRVPQEVYDCGRACMKP